MKTINLVLMVIFLLIIFSVGCRKDNPVVDPSIEAYEKAVMSTGGIMYDKFWSTESGFDQSNPNMEIFNSNSNFFRCKQCHGWDGLGNKGAYISRAPKTTRPNVTAFNLYEMGQTETAQQIFDDLASTTDRRSISFNFTTYDPETNNVEGDKMPNYSEILSEAQMWDIVKYIKTGVFDVSELYDATYEGTYPTGTATFSNIGLNGDAAKGNAYYSANCAVCHGVDGTTLDLEGKTLGKFVRTKANEVQHKVRYGQLGSEMAGQFDITLAEMRDLYKACSDTEAFPDEVPVIGNSSLGGIMYDKFWSTESGFDQSNPNMEIFNSNSNFFRCKQCHGWDGLGNKGAYISRAPKTTRPNVTAFNLYEMGQTETAQQIFDDLASTTDRRSISFNFTTYDPETNNVEGDKMPNFSEILSEAQMWNIVNFIKEGMFDVSELYDATYEGTYPTGTATFANVGLNGDAASGNAYYAANCAACHGDDGTTLEMEGKTLGEFVRTKPNEVQHKVHYGQLGSTMTGKFDISLDEMRNLYKAAADEVAYP